MLAAATGMCTAGPQRALAGPGRDVRRPWADERGARRNLPLGRARRPRRQRFRPRILLRDFDYGHTSIGADGRMVREWEVIAEDREIEVAPGVRFQAWTFNGRIPGPTSAMH